MARRGSSNRWLQRHNADRFVKQRDQQGYRSRAAYKLHQINRSEHLIRPGARVLDLGASPGGWTQVAVELAGARGTVVAVDTLEMAPLAGASVITGDCRDPSIVREVTHRFESKAIDLVMSDMAPNITGVAIIDEAAMAELAHMSLDYVRELLRPGGSLLIKLFQFADTETILQEISAIFAEVSRRKPEASRARSREFYVVAKQYGI